MPATSTSIRAANPSRRRARSTPSSGIHSTVSVSTVAVDDVGELDDEPDQRRQRGDRGEQEQEAATGEPARRCHQAGADDQVEGEQQDHRPAAP